ncbi:MAG: hypothetical protein HY744_27465 [Deltaproteobacteria bacterium]|nr:hypothetical protein [Deltaproteobacteria bacterium]
MRPTTDRSDRARHSGRRARICTALLGALVGCAAGSSAVAVLLAGCTSELAQTPSPDGGGVCDAGDGAVGCEPDGQVIPCERWNTADDNCLEMGFPPFG